MCMLPSHRIRDSVSPIIHDGNLIDFALRPLMLVFYLFAVCAFLPSYREATYTLGGCLGTLTLGHTDYLIFLILYSLVACFSLFQEVRIWYWKAVKKYWLMSVEHALIFIYAVLRALNQLVYYRLYLSVTLSTQVLVSGIPYLFMSWIFSFVIVAWVSCNTNTVTVERRL
jgi:hypothetical protein